MGIENILKCEREGAENALRIRDYGEVYRIVGEVKREYHDRFNSLTPKEIKKIGEFINRYERRIEEIKSQYKEKAKQSKIEFEEEENIEILIALQRNNAVKIY